MVLVLVVIVTYLLQVVTNRKLLVQLLNTILVHFTKDGMVISGHILVQILFQDMKVESIMLVLVIHQELVQIVVLLLILYRKGELKCH